MDDDIGGRSINFRGEYGSIFLLQVAPENRGRSSPRRCLRRRVERTVRSARAGQGGNTRRRCAWTAVIHRTPNGTYRVPIL